MNTVGMDPAAEANMRLLLGRCGERAAEYLCSSVRGHPRL